MAKKKNIVKRAKFKLCMMFVSLSVLGWGLSIYTVFAANDLRRQSEMINDALPYLEDKLYIRAALQYRRALDAYHTEKNPDYEEELLGIYRDGGMQEEYYALIDERIQGGRAKKEEYKERAVCYIENGSASDAIVLLKQAIPIFQDDELTSLYESVAYEYSPTSTTYTDVKLPSADWCIPAYDGEHWGYIGKDGRTILEFIYEEATCFSGDYAVVRLDGVYTLIDKQGYWNAVDKNGLEYVTALCGKRLIGVRDGRYGIYSNTFRMEGEETYDNACLSDNGMIAVQKDGKWALLDPDLKAVTDYQITEIALNSRGQLFSGNYAVVADESGYYLMNQKGEACFEARFAAARGIEGGLFAVADESGRWGFANEKAELLIPCQYDEVYSFSNRLAAVKYAGKWGYMNRYGTMVIEPQFASAYPFLAGSALVTDEPGNYRILTLKYYDLF